MQHDIDPRSLIGRRAVDGCGSKIGTVGEVYLDDATGAPEWAAVRTGLFRREVLVPLEPSELSGGDLRVPYDRALVRCTPVSGTGPHLSAREERLLFVHYGMEPSPSSESSAPSSPAAPES